MNSITPLQKINLTGSRIIFIAATVLFILVGVLWYFKIQSDEQDAAFAAHVRNQVAARESQRMQQYVDNMARINRLTLDRQQLRWDLPTVRSNVLSAATEHDKQKTHASEESLRMAKEREARHISEIDRLSEEIQKLEQLGYVSDYKFIIK